MQHARPIGPTTTNAAAPFGSEMAQGAGPETASARRAWLPGIHRAGWQSHQTTHVSAAFSSDMAQGAKPDAVPALRPRYGWFTLAPDIPQFDVAMVQGWQPTTGRVWPVQRGWLAVPPDVNPFSVEMVVGARPDRPRLFLAPKSPMPWAQTTHVANAFSLEMVEGYAPDRTRERLAPRSPYTVTAPDVLAFSIDMILASRPERARLFQAPRVGWSVHQASTHVANAFSVDMVTGWRPDKQAYSDLRVRTGAFVQMIDVPFTVELIQGWRPDVPLRFRSKQLPLVVPPDVSVFSVEMVIGSRPDQPRIFYAPRFPQAPSQLTHVQTAFAIDMVRGWATDRHRQVLAPKFAYAIVAPDVQQFSIETVRGYRPDKPVLLLGARIPQPVSQTTHVQNAFTPSMVTGEGGQRFRQRLGPKTYGAIPPDVIAFSVDMVVGSRPDRARLFIAPRFQQPPSQTTHVAAAFTPSMSQGYEPQRNREYLPVKIAWQVSQPTPVEANSPEMYAGAQPARSRDWLPTRLGWTQAQTTHVPTAFSGEMAQGSVPATPRLFLHPNPRLFRYHWGDEFKTLTFVIADVVIDLSASAIAFADLPASPIFVLDADGSIVDVWDGAASDIEYLEYDVSGLGALDLDGSEDDD